MTPCLPRPETACLCAILLVQAVCAGGLSYLFPLLAGPDATWSLAGISAVRAIPILGAAMLGIVMIDLARACRIPPGAIHPGTDT